MIQPKLRIRVKATHSFRICREAAAMSPAIQAVRILTTAGRTCSYRRSVGINTNSTLRWKMTGDDCRRHEHEYHADKQSSHRARKLRTAIRATCGQSRQLSEAEEAVIQRGREIFYGEATSEEKEALEDALYALRALKTAWEHTEAA